MKRLACLAATLVLVSPTRAQSTDGLVVYSGGLDALLVDENDAGLRRVLELLDDRALEAGRELAGSAFPAEAARLLCDVASQPWCFRLGPPSDPDAAPFHLQLTVVCDDATEAQGLTRRFVGALRAAGLDLEGGGPGGWTLSTPVGRAVLRSDRIGDATQLRLALGEAREEPFTFADAGLPEGVTPAAYARFDGRVLGPMLAPFAGFAGPEAASSLNALEFLGLLGPEATPRTWALGHSAERMFVVAREQDHTGRARAAGGLVEEPLSREDFARVPVDAGLVALRQFRATAWLDLLDAIEPGAAERVRDEIRRNVGVDLRTEILAPLGPTAGVYASRRTGGGGLMSLVGFVELSDAARFRRAVETLADEARQRLFAGSEGRVGFRDWQHGDTDCTSLAFPGLPVPLELSFAITDDAGWIALSRGALEAALDQRGAERCVLDQPTLARMPESYISDLQGFGFIDPAAYLERGYGTASLLSAALANLVRSPEDASRDAGTVLPNLVALMEAPHPMVTLVRRKGEDLVSTSILDRSWTTNGTAVAGTPLSHSYGLVAGTAAAASVAIPKVMSARVSANEAAAVATLRSVCAAQRQFQAMAVVDCDRDGAGEFGWFGELAGARPVRVPAPTGAAWGRRGEDELEPPFLSPSFAELQDDGTGEGVVMRSGYYFKLFLPGRARGGRAPGHGEPVASTADAPVADPDNGEVAFCCYAWPVDPGRTGVRTFVVNQDGDVVQLAAPGRYGGLAATGGRQPAFDAAYAESDMLAPFGLLRGEAGRDGGEWIPLDR